MALLLEVTRDNPDESVYYVYMCVPGTQKLHGVASPLLQAPCCQQQGREVQ
jgi:hypothetical protein